VAYTLVELERFAPNVGRIRELAPARHPWAIGLDAVCRAVVCLLANDWQTAETMLAPVVEPPAVDVTMGIAAYFYARAQVASGHFREARRTVERMPLDHFARVRDGMLGVRTAVAFGLGAEDSILTELLSVAEREIDRRPLVIRRNVRCRLATWMATAGDVAGAREQLLELDLIDGQVAASIDEELIARATLAATEGCEDDAAGLVARLVDRGAWFPPVDHLVLLYVLRPDLRSRYDEFDLHGVHAQRRSFARALVAARAGDLAPAAAFEWPPPAVVRWFGPAPWLAEVAVLSAAAGGSPPADLAEACGAYASAQRSVVRRLAGDRRTPVARSARAYAAHMPPVAPGPVALRVLGPLEVNVDGVPSVAPELRRERVRSLLGLLVVRRSVSRAEAAGVLWPDLAAEPALANLRVTLTHLLKLLEPQRDKDARPFFVHAEPDRLALRVDPALQVDAWEFEAAAEEAEALERSGAPSLALDALVRAVGYWRGELLSDLGSQEWLDFDRLRLGTQFVRCALRAGELLAAHHEHAAAAVMAERVIAADRWNEAGYRLLAAAHLERGDRSGARRVLAHLDQVLDELGVSAGPDTEQLRLRCQQAD
jgi:DNA-binding SARP family transcriptional activator